MKVRNGSLSYWILRSLEIASENLVVFEDLTYSSQMKALKGIPSQPSKKTLAETLRRLRLKGMVEHEVEQEGKILLKLTSLGREYLNEKQERVWDRKYRIIIWDIPERRKNIRNQLRRRLKEWGFVKWQNSVWVSRQNVTGQLRKLIDDLEIKRWVAVIESDDETLGGLFVR